MHAVYTKTKSQVFIQEDPGSVFFFAAGFIPAYFAKRWEPTVSTTVRLDQNSPLVTFGL